MPYFIEGRVDRLSNMLSLSPEEADERGIDLRRGHEVIGVDSKTKSVRVEADGETFDQPYADLLIATGGRATTGPFDPRELDGAFTLHNMDAAAAIDAYIAEPEAYDFERVDDTPVDRERVTHNAELAAPETAAIIGGGYVGVEMAEALRGRGLDVHLFQRSGHVLPPFGEAVAERVETELSKKGVVVHTNTPVDTLVGEGRIEAVAFDGAELAVDLAIVGVGIQPNTELLSGTGIERGAGGAIRTDEYGRTNLPDVYAAGDCATARHVVTGEETWLPLGLTANRGGRAIGSTVAGEPTQIGDIAGTAVVKAFDQECGRVGILDEATAAEAGFDPVSATITAGSRSGYYPGAAETDVTLVADRETEKLLGGSIVGPDRAAVRVNTLSTALEAGLTVADVEQLDLAYAPPFSPVWDPILVGAKVLNGRLK
jgi:NADPH-dependent 2,4-dienoyl-CoA reductase/sulfur reductase-like enzyme